MTTTVKTGAEHLQSLRDGRNVFIDGERVDDVTTHPAFRNAVQSAAALYDYQAHPDHIEQMTFASPSSGNRVNRSWFMPTTYEEMVQRREAMVAWLRQHGGFMGRSPDHLASALVGQAMGIEIFERHSPARARAFLDFTYARIMTYIDVRDHQSPTDAKAWGER